MTSPTFAAITDLVPALTVDEKRTLYRTLGHDLLAVDTKVVIDAVRNLAQAYEAQGVTGIVAVEFGTSEWDNGYFFAAHSPTLIGANETEIEPTGEQAPDDTYFAEVDDALADCVDTSLGCRSRVNINLVENSLSLDV